MAPKLSLRSGSGCGLAGREAFSLMEGIVSFLWFEVRDTNAAIVDAASARKTLVYRIKAGRLPCVAGICRRAVLLVPCPNELPGLRSVECAKGLGKPLLCQSFDSAPVQVVISNETQQQF